MGPAFACLGVMLPGLLLQDAWRYSFFAAGAGRKAFVNDLVWGVALVPAMVVAARVGSVAAFVLAWGASAAVAAVYGCLQSGIRPRLTGARAWLREHRDLGYRYLVENVSLSGASQLRAYGLGAIVGVGAVGVVRGAELLLGPFLAVLMGLSLVTVAEAARVLRQAPHRLGKFCLLLGGGQAVAALLWGGALLLMPDRLGELVLGERLALRLGAHRAGHPRRRGRRPRHRRGGRAARARRGPAQPALPAVRLRLLRQRRARRGGRRPARSARPGASPPRPSAARPCGGCNCDPPCASATRTPSPK